MKFFTSTQLTAFLAFLFIPLVFRSDFGIARQPESTPVDFKIAFIGDQGLRERSRSVLRLIRDEGTHAVVHSGDFDYDDDPQAWDTQINDILGANFPYFASAGNHDEDNFYDAQGYQYYLASRMQRIGVAWEGDLGARSSFHYQGIFFVLTAPDLFGAGEGDFHEYIDEKLSEDTSVWSISSWHKNMNLMQVGAKKDESGWGVYEASRQGGAIIATGHEHSYSRTHLLANFQEQIVASTSDTLELSPDIPGTAEDEGRTFAFVSGLGGNSIRDQEQDGHWWASIYTSTQDAKAGALFGVFNYQGIENLAWFYFKNIDGEIIDSFFVRSNPDVVSDVDGPLANIPKDFVLEQNYPNPFNPTTEIRFKLHLESRVKIRIFNAIGEEVRLLVDGAYPVGSHGVQWNSLDNQGRQVASGVYLYRLEAGSVSLTKKMTLVR